jgi:hypothetical protein
MKTEILPYVDKKVKEYDFQYAIHLHGPDIVLFPDADDVWNHTKDLYPRIGMCLGRKICRQRVVIITIAIVTITIAIVSITIARVIDTIARVKITQARVTNTMLW